MCSQFQVVLQAERQALGHVFSWIAGEGLQMGRLFCLACESSLDAFLYRGEIRSIRRLSSPHRKARRTQRETQW
jgi:hypothetical protein